jgi:hypothetical protein
MTENFPLLARKAGGLIGACLAVTAWATDAPAASALSVMAPELAKSLGAIPARTIVIVAPLATDVAAPHGDELAVRLASLVAGQLGPAAVAHPRAEPLSVAEAIAAKNGALVYVQAEVAGGKFRAAADLYPVLSNGWDRLRVPLPAPRAHGFASMPIDAEIRAFLTPLTLEHVEVHKAKQDLGDVLAVSCGDVDGGGGNELVLVTRSTVARGRIAGGKFVSSFAAPWVALAARVPVPLREPLATSAIVPRLDGTGGDLFVGTTDRGGVALSRDLRGASPLPGLPLLWATNLSCLTPDPAASVFEGALTDCKTGGAPKVEASLPRFDAIAIDDLVGRDGSSHRVEAMREPDGHLRLRSGDQPEKGVSDVVGAEVAIGDLDEDGVEEVITTSESGDETLTISSWRGHDLVARTRIPAPAPVRALGVCPSSEAGPRPLVAVVGGEVWVVR